MRGDDCLIDAKEIRWTYGQTIRKEVRLQGIVNEVDIARIVDIACNYRKYMGFNLEWDFDNPCHASKIVEESIKYYSTLWRLSQMGYQRTDYGRNMWERWNAYETSM